MKRVSATLFVLIVILAMALTASAQSTPMRANIPFDFTVGDRHLDKGDYRVRVTTLGVLQLQSSDGSAAFSLLQAAPEENRRTRGALMFRRYGDAYFLSKIVWADGVARELPKTRGEIEIARKYPGAPAIETATVR